MKLTTLEAEHRDDRTVHLMKIFVVLKCWFQAGIAHRAATCLDESMVARKSDWEQGTVVPLSRCDTVKRESLQVFADCPSRGIGLSL